MTLFQKNTNLKKTFGQGMTEYIIIVALVAVAAIGAFKMFGQTAQNQIAGLAAELSGQDASSAISQAQGSATAAQTEADRNRAMGTFNGGNDASAN